MLSPCSSPLYRSGAGEYLQVAVNDSTRQHPSRYVIDALKSSSQAPWLPPPPHLRVERNREAAYYEKRAAAGVLLHRRLLLVLSYRRTWRQYWHGGGSRPAVLVIGGAAGGSVAADAALKVMLVETDGLNAGEPRIQTFRVHTSYVLVGKSFKSPKLIHGGLRYLQQAVFELQGDSLRARPLLTLQHAVYYAPYLQVLAEALLPRWMQDVQHPCCRGRRTWATSYVMTKGKALETFPMLKSEGLVGAVVYYDGAYSYFLFAFRAEPSRRATRLPYEYHPHHDRRQAKHHGRHLL